jgi:hypothetical protein
MANPLPQSYVSRQRELFRALEARNIAKLRARDLAQATKQRVLSELKSLGISKWRLLRAETRYLHQYLQPDEHVEAAVYGRSKTGPIMLTATNRRIVFLDKKPLFLRSDELMYDAIRGITLSQVGLLGNMILHTRIGDYGIRTISLKCAHHFKQLIESRCLTQPYQRSPLAADNYQ